MLKFNYKCLLLFLINLNFSLSLENDTSNFREQLIAEWKREFTEKLTPVERTKREVDSSVTVNNGSVNDFNSRSLVVITSGIDDDDERVIKPVECLIKCVANANEIFLISDTLLDDEINDDDQIKMYNRIKHSDDARPLNLRIKRDKLAAEEFIRQYNKQKANKPPLQKVEKVADKSFIVLLDEDSVYTPQVFIHNRPLKIDLDEGTSLQITCSVSSIEDVTLKWVDPKNESLADLSGLKYGTIKHYFDGIDTTQSGNYTCSGQNSFGISKQVLQITVKPSRLSAHIMPTNNYLTETNQPYTLHCKVPFEFVRNSIITWYYNNQSALYNPDLDIGSALIIKRLNRNSNGIYSCSVRMNKIIKSDYIDLKVEYAPELVGNPRIIQNLYIRYDTNYTLSCDVANAVPQPTVIWDIILRHNKKTIKHALPFLPNPDIVFNGFKPTDEGTYTCYGENPLGKTPIRTFHVFGQASVKPKIANSDEFPEKSKKIVLMKEDTVKFLTCKCENCMPLKSIKWFFNGHEITKVDSKLLMYTESYTGNDKVGLLPLIKTDVQKSDEGEYKCHIENEFGSDVFTFDVKVVDFNTENLDEKAKATQIKCELEEEKIQPLVIFKENNDTFLGYNTSRKSYKNDTVSIYGQLYKCTTYDLVYSKNPGFKLGKNALDTFKLFTIIPNITNSALLAKVAKHSRPDYKICKFNDTDNIEGKNMVRSCETKSDPFIVMSTEESEYPQLNQDIQLYKDIYITSKANQFLYLCDLFPYSEKITEKKSYSCSTPDQIGFGPKTFLLYRRERPSVSPSVKDHIKILPGTKELISCDGYGNPEPKVYWTSPTGEKFEQIPKYPNKLEFSIVDEEIAGNYTCNAANIYGRATKDTYVEIINVPKVIHSRNYLEIAADPCQLKQLVCPIENAKNFTWTRTLEEADSKVFSMNFNGNYTCIGENEAGASDFTYIVRGAEAPAGIMIYLTSPESKMLNDLTETESITTEPGKQLTAQCVVHGASPAANIRWLKDNWEYSSDETIEIGSLQPEDMGVYTCTADNERGGLRKSLEVKLRAPPKFSYDLGENPTLSLPYESSTTLDCSAFASPTPTFQWYFNGILLQNERQDKFRLENISGYTNGDYRCVVANPLGSINRVFTVETIDPLSEPSVPTQIEITEPETLRVPCKVANSPTLSQFYWIFDGHIVLGRDDPAVVTALAPNENMYFSDRNELYRSEVEAASNNRIYGIISKSNDGSKISFELIIQNTKFDQESGVYTCFITNSVDKIESSVSVNILAKPQSDEQYETNVIVPEYTPKTFDCVVKGNPETQYTWNLNGQQINHFTDLSIRLQQYGRMLDFANITQKHSGKLRCTGVNKLGTHTHVFNLAVEGPPKIVHPENGTIDEREVEDIIISNEPIEIRCPHIGNPSPDIKWYIVKDDHHDLLNEISDTVTVEPESVIVYCTLENSAGFRKKKFELRKPSSLRFTANPIDNPVKVTLGQYILLNCTMEGTPTPSVQWSKDDVKVPNYDNYIYYVQNSVPDDAGKYRCTGWTNIEEINRDFDVEIVSAVWDKWSEWSACSVTCGVGAQYRTRRCLLNGVDARGMCEGEEVEVYECVQQACRTINEPFRRIPINMPMETETTTTTTTTTTTAPPSIDSSDPQSSIWGPWSQCDLNCHDTINKRYSMRKRYCLDETLMYCNGKNYETQQCNVSNCPIHGGWGAWITGPCSVTCGEGVAMRRRYCNLPAPKHNGRNCHGNRQEAFACKKLCS